MRGWSAILILLLLLGAAGAFSWMTLHPEAPIIERAQSWPIVGGLAQRFRAAYVAPKREGREDRESKGEFVADPGADEAGRGGYDDAIDPSLFEPVAREPTGALPFVWVNEGARLQTRATSESEVAHEFVAPERLSVLERRGDWYRVLPQARRIRLVGETEPVGWVYLPDYDELSDPPFGSQPARLRPLASTPPDTDFLDAARQQLTTEEEWTVGSYRLYSDGGDAQFYEWLDHVVSQLESEYAARYGLRPRDEPQEVIVLFETEEQYRGFESVDRRIAGLSAGGHAFKGLAATWIGDRSRETVASVVLHELVHLVNRRAIGPALPPWLDEGLAEDFATASISPDGEVQVEVVGGTRDEIGRGTVILEGGWASVKLLQKALREGTAPKMETLLTADWDGFVRAEDREVHYAYTGLFLRYLQREETHQKAAFRSFLRDVSEGESADGRVLLSALLAQDPAIERRFHEWAKSIDPLAGFTTSQRPKRR